MEEEEEEEEAYSGMQPRKESSSSDEEQDMILVPLLSPPAEGLNDSGVGGGVPSVPPPLFLGIFCAVRDDCGRNVKEVSPSSHTHCIYTCLSK